MGHLGKLMNGDVFPEIFFHITDRAGNAEGTVIVRFFLWKFVGTRQQRGELIEIGENHGVSAWTVCMIFLIQGVDQCADLFKLMKIQLQITLVGRGMGQERFYDEQGMEARDLADVRRVFKDEFRAEHDIADVKFVRCEELVGHIAAKDKDIAAFDIVGVIIDGLHGRTVQYDREFHKVLMAVSLVGSVMVSVLYKKREVLLLGEIVQIHRFTF